MITLGQEGIQYSISKCVMVLFGTDHSLYDFTAHLADSVHLQSLLSMHKSIAIVAFEACFILSCKLVLQFYSDSVHCHRFRREFSLTTYMVAMWCFCLEVLFMWQACKQQFTSINDMSVMASHELLYQFVRNYIAIPMYCQIVRFRPPYTFRKRLFRANYSISKHGVMIIRGCLQHFAEISQQQRVSCACIKI